MNLTHRLPAEIGGAEVEIVACPPGGTATVRLTTGLTIEVPTNTLTPIAPPCPPEPPIGRIAIDTDGDVWHHKDADGWHFGSRIESWEKLHAQVGPLTVVDGAVNLTNAPVLPCDLPSYDGVRRLHLDHGKYVGQLRVFVSEGESFGRAAVVTVAEAKRAALAMLRFVDEQERGEAR